MFVAYERHMILIEKECLRITYMRFQKRINLEYTFLKRKKKIYTPFLSNLVKETKKNGSLKNLYRSCVRTFANLNSIKKPYFIFFWSFMYLKYICICRYYSIILY